MSENIRRVFKHKRESGKFAAAFAPYGYLRDPNNKNHLIIDETTAPIVRNIFNWYVQGWGYRKIVMRLNELGIVNPSTYKKQSSNYVNTNHEKSHSKGLWTTASIPSIIKREAYIGTLAQGKSHCISYKNKKIKQVPKDDWVRIPDCHEAIIDIDVWQKVQEKLNSKVRANRITQEVHALSGKVYCAECGTSMRRHTYYNKTRTIKYYSFVCGTYSVGAMNCINKTRISGKILENIILEQFNSLINTYCNFDEIAIVNTQKEKIKALENILKQNEEKIQTLEKRSISLYEDKLDGTIAKEQYINLSEKYNKEISEITKKCEIAKQQIINAQDTANALKNKQEIIKKYSNITKLTRAIVEEFVDTIEIGAKTDEKDREVKINWNF